MKYSLFYTAQHASASMPSAEGISHCGGSGPACRADRRAKARRSVSALLSPKCYAVGHHRAHPQLGYGQEVAYDWYEAAGVECLPATPLARRMRGHQS